LCCLPVWFSPVTKTNWGSAVLGHLGYTDWDSILTKTWIGVHNGLPRSCSGNSVDIWVVFKFKNSSRLIIGSGSCWTRLCNRVD
jgi:hypothetical protein